MVHECPHECGKLLSNGDYIICGAVSIQERVGLPDVPPVGRRYNLAMLKPRAGTYALVLFSTKVASVNVGKLGTLRLQPGFYVYIGSAHGPGGLRARLAHHLKPTGRPHWHIDFLKTHASTLEVWYSYDRILWECRWAHCLGTLPGASLPLIGFGSSDCGCETHLYFFGSRPSRLAFAREVEGHASQAPSRAIL